MFLVNVDVIVEVGVGVGVGIGVDVDVDCDVDVENDVDVDVDVVVDIYYRSHSINILGPDNTTWFQVPSNAEFGQNAKFRKGI